MGRHNALDGQLVIRKRDDHAPAALGLFKTLAVSVAGCGDPQAGRFHFEGRVSAHHVVRVEARGRYLGPLAAL